MKKPKYKYRIYYTTKGKPFTMDVVVFNDSLKAALNRFYKDAFNYDEVTYAEKIGEVKEGSVKDVMKKIDMFLINEAGYGLFGKEKSKIWLDLRDKILNSKKKEEIQSLMKKITDLYKAKKLSLSEFKDLIDKIDMKIVKMKI